MHPNPVPAMDWNSYVNRAKAEWNNLLNSEAACDEKNIRRFLATHPSFVPGAGRGSFPMALISEPPLTGIGRKIPDFVWLASDSLNFSPILIEIESPCKSWFTQSGVPHHDLTQAINQLAECCLAKSSGKRPGLSGALSGSGLLEKESTLSTTICIDLRKTRRI